MVPVSPNPERSPPSRRRRRQIPTEGSVVAVLAWLVDALGIKLFEGTAAHNIGHPRFDVSKLELIK